MNILVVNGSPKGKYSVTLQTSNWLQLKFPKCNFDVIHAGQIIKKLERDFTEAKEKLEKADLVIFSYPVYTFIAPCQLHRFIELMKESGRLALDEAGLVAYVHGEYFGLKSRRLGTYGYSVMKKKTAKKRRAKGLSYGGKKAHFD